VVVEATIVSRVFGGTSRAGEDDPFISLATDLLAVESFS
jgi:hypothetical protein